VKHEPAPIFERPVVIVGGGVSGLAMAHLLSESGVSVVVLERDAEIGGLAKSYRYDGFVFDVGPHRFHTQDPHVNTWIHRVVAEEAILFPRLSEVYFQGRYFRWPLHPSQLIQLPPALAAKSGLDLAANTFRTYDIDSFESYVLRQYGPTLYTHFFKDYSEKFLGIHPRETHPDWATAGLSRAIIDDKLQMQNLTQLIKSTLLQFNKAEIDFLYPRHGMFAVWRNLQRSIEARGGRILTGVDARMEVEGDRVVAVQANDERIEPSLVIWTGTIGQACHQLGLPEFNLPYRALLLYNVMVDRVVPRKYQWCYYGAKDLVFSRISIPLNFSKDTCPTGTTGLCVEVTCMEDDIRWKNGEKLTDWVVDDLIRVDMIPHRRAVQDVRLERAGDSYPVYHVTYPSELEKAQAALSRFTNLHMAGRNGTFWYNNMDHCVEAAFTTVKRLLRDAGCANVEDADLAEGRRS